MEASEISEDAAGSGAENSGAEDSGAGGTGDEVAARGGAVVIVPESDTKLLRCLALPGM